MLQSQQRLEMQKLPARVHNPVNRLRNDIIDLLDQNDMDFKHSEAGEQIVQAHTNILWYVDGHHEVLRS